MPWEGGGLRVKAEGGKTSVHLNGSSQNVELLLQMAIFVNQLSIDGEVADMIEEKPVGQKVPGKPAAPGQLDKRRDHRWQKIHVKVLHQRSPYAMKFEDRSHAETERQERCARSKAWNCAKNIHKLREKDQVIFCSPAEE